MYTTTKKISTFALFVLLSGVVFFGSFATHTQASTGSDCPGPSGDCTSSPGGGGYNGANAMPSAVTPTTATIGVPVAFSSVTTNTGDVATNYVAYPNGTGSAAVGSANYTDEFQISTNDGSTYTNIGSTFTGPVLASGASATINAPTTYTFTSGGTYWVRAVTDTTDVIYGDLDAGDNALLGEDTVGAAGLWTAIVVPSLTPTASLSANPATIQSGGSSTLSWSSSNVTSCTGTNFSTGNATSGSVAVSPGSTISYSISCIGAGGTAVASTQVSVAQLPIINGTTGGTASTIISQPVTLTGTASNSGSGAAGDFPNVIQVCDANCATVNSLMSTVDVSSLAAGATSGTLSASYTPAEVTQLYYRFCGNMNTSGSYVIQQPSYTNNCGSWSLLNVGPAPIPNITAATGGAATATINVPVTLTGTVLNTTNNGGTGPAGSFPNVIQVCDANCVNVVALIDATNVSSLALGASAPVSASYTPATMEPLLYRVCGNENTSWANVITESNYGDNCGSWSTLTVNYPAPTGTCSVSPTTVTTSQTPATWTVTPSGGSGTYTYQWGGSVSGTNSSESPALSAGSYTGQVTITSGGQNYTAQCSPGGSSNTPLTVVSCNSPGFFTANPSTVAEGQESQLNWSVPSVCASSCTGNGFSTGAGNPISGSAYVKPVTVPTSNYALSCGSQPNLNASVAVNVPSVTLTATPDRVSAPSAANAITLIWDSPNNTSPNTCTITREGVTLPGSATTLSGTTVDPNPITAQTVYTASCTTGTPGNQGIPATATAIVNIVSNFNEF